MKCSSFFFFSFGTSFGISCILIQTLHEPDSNFKKFGNLNPTQVNSNSIKFEPELTRLKPNLNPVDANFFLLDLGQNCTYKTINTFGQGQEPHVPTMIGGALAEEPLMPKLEFREKVFKNFGEF